MKPVVFHREAQAELDGAIAWYENQRAGLGVDLLENVEDAIFRMRSKPTKHPRHKQSEARKCRVKRFPYTVYFLDLEEVIWIAAIAHDKRKPDYWVARQPED